MTKANLEGKVVSQEFWPRCGNCRYYSSCQESPRHAAFPHVWHWSREGACFSDGTILLLKSWVGTAAYGVDHTGCYQYQADDKHLIEPQEYHVQYLELQKELGELEVRLNNFEKRMIWNDGAEEVSRRYFNVLDKMTELENGA